MYRGVFSLVCFLIYGVKRRSGHDRSQIYGVKRRSGHNGSQSFGPIWHVSGPKMVFWRNDIMILHHFCWRSWKIKLFWPKTLIFDQKFRKYPKKSPKIFKNQWIPRIPMWRPMWRVCWVHPIQTVSKNKSSDHESESFWEPTNLVVSDKGRLNIQPSPKLNCSFLGIPRNS